MSKHSETRERNNGTIERSPSAKAQEWQRTWESLETKPDMQDDFVEASRLVMVLPLSDSGIEQANELEGSGELFTKKGFELFNEHNPDVVETMKALRTQYAMFAGLDAPFHYMSRDEARDNLAYDDFLAWEYFSKTPNREVSSVVQEKLQRKRSLLLGSMQVFYGRDTVYQTQEEVGYYLGALPPGQILYVPRHERETRGVYTQQLFRGESIKLDANKVILSEQEVLDRYRIQSGALVGMVRAGNPMKSGDNITFGVFAKDNNESAEFRVHYMPSVAHADLAKRYAGDYLKQDDTFFPTSVLFGREGMKSSYVGVSSRRHAQVVPGMLAHVNKRLKEGGTDYTVQPPGEVLGEYHLNISQEGDNLVIHDTREDTLGVTLVQSAVFKSNTVEF